MSDIVKFDKIIPVGRQEYAYQCENVGLIMKITGHFSNHSHGKEPIPNDEKELLQEWNQYELEINRHTGNAINVNFRKFYKDGKVELYTFGTSFSHLVNQIFHKCDCDLIIEKEARK